MTDNILRRHISEHIFETKQALEDIEKKLSNQADEISLLKENIVQLDENIRANEIILKDIHYEMTLMRNSFNRLEKKGK